MGEYEVEIDKRIQLFEKQANNYARRVKRKSSDHKYRKELLRSAKGNILELSVGAGANFQYYPKNANVTAVDFSPSMIEKAKGAAREQKLDVEFLISNVEDLSLPKGSYDTVVSTLSLCSYPNPDKVLEKISEWCREEGSILLFEHGISSNPVYAWAQNKADAYVERKIGCHMNRDILNMVKQSPLHVQKVKSFLLSSIHLIWAAPKKIEDV